MVYIESIGRMNLMFQLEIIKKPTICDEDNLLAVSQVLQNVEILSGDFEQTINYANEEIVSSSNSNKILKNFPTPPKSRCHWVDLSCKEYISYHDKFWGVPQHNDNKLFEMLVLEGAQAGLSWLTILRKQKNYTEAFDSFDPLKVSNYDQKKIEELMQDKGIVRNRRKISSAIKNARVFIKIQEEFESFDKYIWAYVDYCQIDGKIKNEKDLVSKSKLSRKISQDLKKRGMNFVGPTIIYAFMQAVGMVNDHLESCFRYQEIKNSTQNMRPLQN